MAAMTRRGSTFHPCWVISSISGWYFWILLLIVYWENLSFVDVNLISCLLGGLVGYFGVCVRFCMWGCQPGLVV